MGFYEINLTNIENQKLYFKPKNIPEASRILLKLLYALILNSLKYPTLINILFPNSKEGFNIIGNLSGFNTYNTKTRKFNHKYIL